MQLIVPLVFTLPLSILALLVLAACAILEVAFRGPQGVGASAARAHEWQPPPIGGDELFTWAADTAKAATARLLIGTRGRETAIDVAGEIYAGMAQAVAGSPGAAVEREHDCASCRHQRIGVTAPEALAIADALRSSRPSRDVRRIRDSAARNASGAGQPAHKQGVVCPLLCSDGTCAVFDARPVHCRGWRLLAGPDERAPRVDAHVQTVGHGAEAGLCRGLESAGLDGTVYELNSALVVALDTPSAGERWAAGAPVFEHCAVYE